MLKTKEKATQFVISKQNSTGKNKNISINCQWTQLISIFQLMIIEEPQKYFNRPDIPGQTKFTNNDSAINCKGSQLTEQGTTCQSHSLNQPIDSKLQQGLLSYIIHSNFSQTDQKSDKQQKKQISSNISELPFSSNVSEKLPTKTSNVASKHSPASFSTEEAGSSQGQLSIKTTQDNLVFPREYTRTFRLKSNADPNLCLQIFKDFINQNGFQTKRCEYNSIWVRKTISYNVLKLIFHFCCGVSSNIADYQLVINNDNIELRLLGESNIQNQKMMKKLEYVLWGSRQLKLSEQQNIDFFLSNEDLSKLTGELKYIIRTSQFQSGLQMCMFHCFQYINQHIQRFQLINGNGKLSQRGQLLIQKRLFDSSKLFYIFKRQFQKSETKLVNKKQQILGKMTRSQCFQYLEVNSIYRLELSSDENAFPYQSAIRILEDVNCCSTPQEKLQCINNYYQTIQECCKTFHKGSVVLESMDSILPILIFTLVFVKTEDIYANIKLVELFVKQISSCEPQLKMLANLYASIEYISNCWVVI